MKQRLDDKLDEALKETFPASDSFELTPGDLPDSGPTYASPPCFMHELDPTYLGYLGRDEILTLLNLLLEGQRAGSKGVSEMGRRAAGRQHREFLRRIAEDEARFCAMLSNQIRRFGGTPSAKTGTFYESLAAAASFEQQLELLERGQLWVVRQLRDALPRIADDELCHELGELLAAHEKNMELCKQFAA